MGSLGYPGCTVPTVTVRGPVPYETIDIISIHVNIIMGISDSSCIVSAYNNPFEIHVNRDTVQEKVTLPDPTPLRG